MRILIYGYGNPGRQDDALGIKFIESLKSWLNKNKFRDINLDYNYQLNLEDAYNLKNYDVVIFVDSTKKRIKNFNFKLLESNFDLISYTSHRFNPETLVILSKKLFNTKILAFILTIKGYNWNFGEKISQKALKNLKNALIFIKKFIHFLKNRKVNNIKKLLTINNNYFITF